MTNFLGSKIYYLQVYPNNWEFYILKNTLYLDLNSSIYNKNLDTCKNNNQFPLLDINHVRTECMDFSFKTFIFETSSFNRKIHIKNTNNPLDVLKIINDNFCLFKII